MKENHVKHVLTGQKNILTMSNNYTKQLEKISNAEKADCNIPHVDTQSMEEIRRNDAKIVREIAQTVTSMRKEILNMKIKIDHLTKENKEIKENCNNRKTLHKHPNGNKPANYQPSKTIHTEESTPNTNLDKNELPYTEVKKTKKK